KGTRFGCLCGVLLTTLFHLAFSLLGLLCCRACRVAGFGFAVRRLLTFGIRRSFFHLRSSDHFSPRHARLICALVERLAKLALALLLQSLAPIQARPPAPLPARHQSPCRASPSAG